jgi:thiol-disulfide isomerase/thioredoxin
VARAVSVLAALAGLALLVACTAEHPPLPPAPAPPVKQPTEVTSPLAACPPAQGPSAPDSLLAGISLPCLTGGEDLELGRIGRPLVINLWASWCGPCRAELPELQRFADAAGDRVVLLGVVTGDTRSAATSLAADLAITFPSVFDAQEQVKRATGQPPMPQTLFVDAAGNVRHVYAGPPLTTEGLADLTRTHLGVSVG